jgi:DNA-binding SARP family transcriptional activator
MLEKLMEHCESSQRYEYGVEYGNRILRYDLARERTHYRLMRLLCLAGNRTEALRQFERCSAVLQEELGVVPSRSTRELHLQILAERLEPSPQAEAIPAALANTGQAEVVEEMGAVDLLRRLVQMAAMLIDVQVMLKDEISLVEKLLNGRFRL